MARLFQLVVLVEDPVLCTLGPWPLEWEGETIGVRGDELAGAGPMKVMEAGLHSPVVVVPLSEQRSVNLALLEAIQASVPPFPPPLAVQSQLVYPNLHLRMYYILGWQNTGIMSVQPPRSERARSGTDLI